MSETEVDVLVVGGGMVGATLAHSLATLPFSCLVIDSQAPRDGMAVGDSFDSRTTALANGSQRILDAMGLWSGLAAQTQPITSIHISDQGGFGFARIHARDEGVPALGYTLENSSLGACLVQARSGEVPWWTATRLETIETRDDRVLATVVSESGHHTVSARLLVGADGAGSRVRELLQVDVRHHDYGQTATIANLTTSTPHQGRAYERFTRVGPLAMLPLTRDRVGVVWTQSRGQAEAAAEWDEAQFRDRLQRAFGYRLGRLGRIGRRFQYPLAAQHASAVVASRVVLVGNAANTLHPVAGQGFNLALRDVAVVVELLCREAEDGGTDPGRVGLTDHYASWRGADHRRVRLFTHNLVKLFGSGSPGIKTGRGLGLLAFDLLPGTKSVLARHTMGLAGHLPRLARGVSLTS